MADTIDLDAMNVSAEVWTMIYAEGPRLKKRDKAIRGRTEGHCAVCGRCGRKIARKNFPFTSMCRCAVGA